MVRPTLALGANGGIWTKELPGGKTQARCRVKDADGILREVSATGDSATEAVANLEARLRARLTLPMRAITDKKNLTFADIAAMWLEWRSEQGIVKPSTLGQYQSCLEQVLLPQFGHYRLREINRSVLETGLDDIRRGNRKGHDKNLRPFKGRPVRGKQPLIVAIMVVRWAWKKGLLPENYLGDRGAEDYVAVKKYKADQAEIPGDEIRGLSDDDIDLLFTLLAAREKPSPRGGRPADSTLREVSELMLAAGLRIGEACALRWTDLDFLPDGGVKVSVTGTFVEPRGDFLEVPTRLTPKSLSGVRRITIDGPVVPMLHERQARAKHRKPTDYVFATRTGLMPWPNTLRNGWRKAIKDTRLDGISPHVLRKTFANRNERLLGIDRLALAMGHANKAITEGAYLNRLVPDVDVRPRANVPTQRPAAADIDPYDGDF